jgi:hypothetical protein
MTEREIEVQEEVSIRTGIKAGDDGSQMGTGSVTGTGLMGSGGKQTGSGG